MSLFLWSICVVYSRMELFNWVICRLYFIVMRLFECTALRCQPECFIRCWVIKMPVIFRSTFALTGILSFSWNIWIILNITRWIITWLWLFSRKWINKYIKLFLSDVSTYLSVYADFFIAFLMWAFWSLGCIISTSFLILLPWQYAIWYCYP